MTMSVTNGVESDALNSRLKATWMSGNYDYFSRFMESSAVEFLERLPLRAGDRFLDVACGSGQLALLAARQGATVTGVDFAANWIQAARGRAASEGLSATFDEGDAETLPYPDKSFDIVASIFGAMFAQRPERVASELVRVCRSGGTVAMANWTRDGFIGRMFQTIGRFIAPSGMPSPLLWGDETTVQQRFGDTMSHLGLRRVQYRFDYPFPPDAVVDFFREHYGPMNRAFAAVPEASQTAMRTALIDLWSEADQSRDAQRTIVDAEYLEVLATKTRTQ
jgi:ubiquinone/menaquinone biosynthesis C-methylase UbiE